MLQILPRRRFYVTISVNLLKSLRFYKLFLYICAYEKTFSDFIDRSVVPADDDSTGSEA